MLLRRLLLRSALAINGAFGAAFGRMKAQFSHLLLPAPPTTIPPPADPTEHHAGAAEGGAGQPLRAGGAEGCLVMEHRAGLRLGMECWL